jgi:hypothetical protein
MSRPTAREMKSESPFRRFVVLGEQRCDGGSLSRGRMTAMLGATLTIPARFNGPPSSANGGYFAARLAACLLAVTAGAGPRTAITVTLRRPPPLEEAMDLVPTETGTLTAWTGDVLIAEAGHFSDGFDEVEPASFDDARSAAQYYGGLVEHPFPTCFSCGVARPESDGLDLRPGLLPNREGVTATSWRPDGSLTDRAGAIKPEFIWAALDCPGGWTVDLVGWPMVLGRMSGQVIAASATGEPCVVMGRLDGRVGRKALTSTTAYGGDGRLLGHARAVWIEVSAP